MHYYCELFTVIYKIAQLPYTISNILYQKKCLLSIFIKAFICFLSIMVKYTKKCGYIIIYWILLY